MLSAFSKLRGRRPFFTSNEMDHHLAGLLVPYLNLIVSQVVDKRVFVAATVEREESSQIADRSSLIWLGGFRLVFDHFVPVQPGSSKQASFASRLTFGSSALLTFMSFTKASSGYVSVRPCPCQMSF